MQMINEPNITKARNQIQSMASKKKKPIVVLSQDGDYNQKILDNKYVDALVLNESRIAKDYMKQRDSGLNEVLCKLAKKNGIKIAVDANAIARKSDIEQAKALARLGQNIMLCKKSGCDLVIYGDFDKKSIMSLFLTLGASTSQAKKAAEASL